MALSNANYHIDANDPQLSNHIMKWKRYDYVDYTHVTDSTTTSRKINLVESDISLTDFMNLFRDQIYNISSTLTQHNGKTYSSSNHEMYLEKEKYYPLSILLKITLSLRKRRYRASIMIHIRYLYLFMSCIDMQRFMLMVLIAMKIIMK